MPVSQFITRPLLPSFIMLVAFAAVVSLTFQPSSLGWTVSSRSAAPANSARPLPASAAAAAVKMVDEGVDENSPQYRAKKAAEWEATAAARRVTAAELALSAEEVGALTEASKSLLPCWTGDVADCPDDLKSKFTMQPLDFFSALRRPAEDPDPAVWTGVRDKWPSLAARSDDDLLAALQPIKDVKVDKRSLM